MDQARTLITIKWERNCVCGVDDFCLVKYSHEYIKMHEKLFIHQERRKKIICALRGCHRDCLLIIEDPISRGTNHRLVFLGSS